MNENYGEDLMKIESVTLESFRKGVSRVVSHYDMRGIRDVDSMIETLADRMVFHLRASVLGERIDSKEISFPADWWESFKERWAPQWWLRRWPVKRTVWKASLDVLYPNFKPKLPDSKSGGHVVKFLVTQR